MYKAEKIGIHRGKLTGKRYSFFPGHTINAPSGDLHGLPGVRWIGEQPERVIDEPKSEVVIPDQARSSDYTVREVKKMVKHMTPDQLKAFTKGDSRKTVKKFIS